MRGKWGKMGGNEWKMGKNGEIERKMQKNAKKCKNM